jgi:aspartyl-tRNA(Asn)/glutamyl-tRNA(Gln) amidotransferase subunit C
LVAFGFLGLPIARRLEVETAAAAAGRPTARRGPHFSPQAPIAATISANPYRRNPSRRNTRTPQIPHAAMALTLADVHRIAHLARIEIDATAAAEVHRKLEAIFAMINELQAVDTTGIVPMAHAQDVMLPLREDRVSDTDQHALFQSVAPAVEDGLYLVPRVVE